MTFRSLVLLSITAFLFAGVAHPVYAVQESSNYSLEEDAITFGSSMGQGDTLTLYGTTLQIEGLSQSTNLTQHAPVLQAGSPPSVTPIPSTAPKPAGSSGSSSNTSSSTSTSNNSSSSNNTTTSNPVTNLIIRFFNPGTTETPSTAKQLFDIKLELVKSTLSKSGDLSIRIRFGSFGKIPTLVDLTYAILDSKDKEVWRQKDSVTVETEKVILKDFKSLSLPDGKYTFVLTTLYNTSVKDEFKQSFTIDSNFQTQALVQKYLWLIVLIAIFFIVLVARRKKNKEKI